MTTKNETIRILFNHRKPGPLGQVREIGSADYNYKMIEFLSLRLVPLWGQQA
jgi:hypothetical protein